MKGKSKLVPLVWAWCMEYATGVCLLDQKPCKIMKRQPCDRFRDQVLLSAVSDQDVLKELRAGLDEYNTVFMGKAAPYSKRLCPGCGDHPCGLPKRAGSHVCESCAKRLRKRRQKGEGREGRPRRVMAKQG